MKFIILFFLLVSCAHATHPRGEQQEMGFRKWLQTSDEMDADYANQTLFYIDALEMALDLSKKQTAFWREHYAEAVNDPDGYGEIEADELFTLDQFFERIDECD